MAVVLHKRQGLVAEKCVKMLNFYRVTHCYRGHSEIWSVKCRWGESHRHFPRRERFSKGGGERERVPLPHAGPGIGLVVAIERRARGRADPHAFIDE